jgi:rare lipoprotein A (peptidoglycan hydrolase)
MKVKIYVLLQAVFLAGMTLVVVPAFRPAAGEVNTTHSMSGATASSFQAPGSKAPMKPLKSWVAVSSWYGEDFDGQQTANGEIYDMYAATAAHPTLPLGSIVRVINLRNHRSEIVRINDRGPYVEGRDLDVSYGVAKRLGFVHRGLDRVRIELLEVPSRTEMANLN